MTISIVTNTFRKYHRQDIAVDSWRHLKKLFPDNINLNNFQFEDERNTFTDHYDGVDTSFRLKNSSKSLVKGATKKLPLVSEIIFAGFKYDPEYVLFTNSDVILMPHLIEYILNEKPDCMAISRMDIEHIESFDNILRQDIKPVRMEIAGFDAFLLKREWFTKHKKHLWSNFLLGKPYFDPALAGLMVIFGEKFKMGNSYPPYAFHIHHGTASVDMECPERDHNQKIFEKNPLFQIGNNIIFHNLQHNLCKRKPWGAFLQPQKDEQKIQEDFFREMNICELNKIRYIE
jgi:hypothetical protein